MKKSAAGWDEWKLSDLFVPKWAEKALNKPKPFDEAELECLREFFAAWEEFHALPKNSLHRKKAESAAQKMVEKAMAIRQLVAPKRGTLTLAGVKVIEHG